MEEHNLLSLLDAGDTGMEKNSPKSLPDFQRMFQKEEACRDYLYAARFHNGSVCPSDGWTGCENLQKLGCRHGLVKIRDDYIKSDQYLPMIHIVFENLDTWPLGTRHGVSRKHL